MCDLSFISAVLYVKLGCMVLMYHPCFVSVVLCQVRWATTCDIKCMFSRFHKSIKNDKKKKAFCKGQYYNTTCIIAPVYTSHGLLQGGDEVCYKS